MDNKKDTFYKTNGLVERQKDDNLVDNKSMHGNKDVFKNDGALGKSQENDFGGFLNKKIERLVTALYMVTSFLSDNEPLKWKLRDCNVVLLSGINNARSKSTSEVENIFVGHFHVVDEIVSLLEISAASKLISEMNFSILKKEYVELKVVIDSREHSKAKSGKFTFASDFFAQGAVQTDNIKDTQRLINPNESKEVLPPSSPANIKDIDKGQLLLQKMSFGLNKRHKDISNTNKPSFSYNATQRDAQSHRVVKQIVKKEKTDRKGAILKLFKKGKELTIKDISCEVFGCSEKTIQRELLSLVVSGLLSKKGERRWSKYSLK